MDSQNKFFDFSSEGSFRSEEGIFDQLLGDGGAALEFLVKDNLFKRADNAFPGEAAVVIELAVFNG